MADPAVPTVNEVDLDWMYRAVYALALELPAAVWDDFAPRCLALISALRSARAERDALRETVAEVERLRANNALIERALHDAYLKSQTERVSSDASYEIQLLISAIRAALKTPEASDG